MYLVILTTKVGAKKVETRWGGVGREALSSKNALGRLPACAALVTSTSQCGE